MTPAELARHIDRPDARHRLVLLDTTRLRCTDCTQTVLLTAPVEPTSTSGPIPRTTDPRCREHPTEHVGGCRWCAADAKATTDEPPTKPLAGWATRTTQATRRTPPRMPVREPSRETSAT